MPGFALPVSRDFEEHRFAAPRNRGGMRKYVLEVRAKFEHESPNGKAEQLAHDIAHHILDVHDPENHREQIICEDSFTSPLFHRLYMNLVDTDNTLETKVEKLRKDYSPHRASFSLTHQAD
jgi:hypothetical protein